MTPARTLLVSRTSSVIDDIRQLHDGTGTARLEVSGRLDSAMDRLDDRNGVLLVDVGGDIDPRQAEAVMSRAAGRPGVRAGAVCTAVAGRPRPAAYPTYRLPDDLDAIRRLIEADPPAGPAAADLRHLAAELGADLPTVLRAAGQDVTILLTGETGCGKTMLTRIIHAASPRRDEPCVVADCGALAQHLIESELFGHVRGAFTGADREREGKFAAAGAGTLVLDEINSFPLGLQAKLLRAVEERVYEPVGCNRAQPIRSRLVAVSNVPLEDEVRNDRFRADLFYRLNVVEFRLCPLRERPGATPALAARFLRDSRSATARGLTGLTDAALEAMVAYQWPGNVRELRNVIDRAAALADGPLIDVADLPAAVRGSFAGPPRPAEPGPARLAPPPDLCQEAAVILDLLARHRNNRQRAAAELGISRVALYNKMHRYGIFARKGHNNVRG